VGVLKQQIGGSEIGKLSQVISLSSIKNSLKNKLLRRINANPFLLDQVYRQVDEIVARGGIDFPQLEVDTSDVRRNLGNCVVSDLNLVKAMRQHDALGVAFEIERPISAIADPGRIRIRQVSPSLMSASTFFEHFLYKIKYTPDVVRLVFERCRKCTSKYCSYFGSCEFLVYHLKDSQTLSYTYEIRKAHGVDSWNQNSSNNDFNPNVNNHQDNIRGVTREIDYLREAGEL
jgi:hypothetical protein